MADFFGDGGHGNFMISRMERDLKNEGEFSDRASRKGVAQKTLFFVGITFFVALATYLFIIGSVRDFVYTGDYSGFMFLYGMLIASIIVGVICWIVCMFSARLTKIFGTLYAVCEGVLLGTISLLAEMAFPGIIFMALAATATVFFVMAGLYYSGTIKVSNRFRSTVIVAAISMLFLMLILFIIGLFSAPLMNLFFGTGILSIIISAIMVILASFMVLVNLRGIDDIVEAGMPKQYEWRAAFSMLIVIIWLYVEILVLLMKIKARR